jgi:8-oxo-dGTP diphosphatase
VKRDFAVAVKAVIIKENRALVLCRSKGEMEGSFMNSYQKWDLPGGGLHFFEKAEEGLVREIAEETSLTVSIGPPLSLFDVIKHHIHLCIFTYACEWKQGEVVLSEEHEAYYWMTEAEMEESELPHWMKRDIRAAFALQKKASMQEIE